MTILLVLRPEPGAARTALRAEAAGWRTMVSPLFEIIARAWQVPEAGAHDALMLTSANAVRHAGTGLAEVRHLPTYAVGGATGEAAREAGLDVVAVGEGGVTELMERMAAARVRAPLHLAGEEHRAETHPALTLTRRIVYAAGPVATLSKAALDAIGEGAIALIHSPRAGAQLGTLIDVAGLARGDVRIAAISAQAADAAGEGWRAVAVARVPDDQAVLAAAASLCEKARRSGGAPGRS